jgi:hypothetical protein
VAAVCPAAAVWAGCTKRPGAAAAPQNYAGRTNRAEWAECTKSLDAAAAPQNYAGRTNRAEWAGCTNRQGAAAAPLNYAGRTNRAWVGCTRPQSDRKEMKGAPRNRGALFVLCRADRNVKHDEK